MTTLTTKNATKQKTALKALASSKVANKAMTKILTDGAQNLQSNEMDKRATFVQIIRTASTVANAKKAIAFMWCDVSWSTDASKLYRGHLRTIMAYYSKASKTNQKLIETLVADHYLRSVLGLMSGAGLCSDKVLKELKATPLEGRTPEGKELIMNLSDNASTVPKATKVDVTKNKKGVETSKIVPVDSTPTVKLTMSIMIADGEAFNEALNNGASVNELQELFAPIQAKLPSVIEAIKAEEKEAKEAEKQAKAEAKQAEKEAKEAEKQAQKEAKANK